MGSNLQSYHPRHSGAHIRESRRQSHAQEIVLRVDAWLTVANARSQTDAQEFNVVDDVDAALLFMLPLSLDESTSTMLVDRLREALLLRIQNKGVPLLLRFRNASRSDARAAKIQTLFLAISRYSRERRVSHARRFGVEDSQRGAPSVRDTGMQVQLNVSPAVLAVAEHHLRLFMHMVTEFEHNSAPRATVLESRDVTRGILGHRREYPNREEDPCTPHQQYRRCRSHRHSYGVMLLTDAPASCRRCCLACFWSLLI